MSILFAIMLLAAVLVIALAVTAARCLWPGTGVSVLRRLTLGTALAAAIAALLVVTRWMAWPYTQRTCPLEDRLDVLQHPVVVVDRDGRYMGTTEQGRGRYVPLEALRPGVPESFVAAEDHRFFRWYHTGVDPVGVVAAAYGNLAKGERRGASSIAMQVARALCGPEMPPDHTWSGKLAETALALELVHRLGKRLVLELYLNSVFLGHGRRGIDAAADEYFGKHAEDLTQAESLHLAGWIFYPAGIAPDGVGPDALAARRTQVLARALALVDSQAVDVSGFRRPVRFAPGIPLMTPIRDLITAATATAPAGGDTLHLAVDMRLQEAAQRELEYTLAALERAGAGRTGPLLGIFVAMDAETGELLAYVGRRPGASVGPDWIQVARVLPSSALKAILLTAAFDHGWQPDERLKDVERERCPGIWLDPWTRGMRGRGNSSWSLAQALPPSANDLGPCALDALPDSAIRALAAHGLLSPAAWRPMDGLGIQPVAPLDLLQAFGAIAGGGQWREVSYQRVSAPAPGDQMFSPAASRTTMELLEATVEHGTGRGVRRYLIDEPAAGKTGTATGNTELVFVGISGRIVSLVWVGHATPEPVVRNGSAGSVVAPAWGRVMARYYAQSPGRMPSIRW